MAEYQNGYKLNNRLSASLTVSLLAGMLVIVGWIISLTGRVGIIEGNRYTAADGIAIERQISQIDSILRSIEFRLGVLEHQNPFSVDTAKRLSVIESDIKKLKSSIVRVLHEHGPPIKQE